MDETSLSLLNSYLRCFSRYTGRVAIVLLLWWGNQCAAAEYVENFDDIQSGKTTWRASFDTNFCRMVQQSRVPRAYQGAGSEFLHLQAVAQGTKIELRHSLPRTQVLDATYLSVWVLSDHVGSQLSVRLVLPHQVDPTTNRKGLTIPFVGDSYTNKGEWQQLHCRLQKLAVQRTIGWARNYYETDIDMRDMYIDLVYLTANSAAGPVKFQIDDMRLGPQVQATEIIPVDRDRSSPARSSPAKFRLDQLSVEGKPTFLRILPYHDEDPSELARMRFNVVWVRGFQDARDQSVLQNLRAARLWAIAIPPKPPLPTGKQLMLAESAWRRSAKRRKGYWPGIWEREFPLRINNSLRIGLSNCGARTAPINVPSWVM